MVCTHPSARNRSSQRKPLHRPDAQPYLHALGQLQSLLERKADQRNQINPWLISLRAWLSIPCSQAFARDAPANHLLWRAFESRGISAINSSAAPSIPRAPKRRTIAAPVPAPTTKAIQIPQRSVILGSLAFPGAGAASEVYFSASVEIRLVIIPVRYVV